MFNKLSDFTDPLTLYLLTVPLFPTLRPLKKSMHAILAHK